MPPFCLRYFCLEHFCLKSFGLKALHAHAVDQQKRHAAPRPPSRSNTSLALAERSILYSR